MAIWIVVIPHYDHQPLFIQAIENDLHVLAEKPVGVEFKKASILNEGE